MQEQQLSPQFAELDEQALLIINQRLPALLAFLDTCRTRDAAWRHWPPQAYPDQFVSLFQTIEQETPAKILQNEYFLPFADALGLRDTAQKLVLHSCLQSGLFDIPHTYKFAFRPSIEAIVPEVDTILVSNPFKKYRVTALIEAGICHDKQTATEVANQFEPKYFEPQVAALARGIILASLAYGYTGLLHISSYPYYDELILLERRAPLIAQLSADPQRYLTVLRADVVALCKAFQSVDQKLWQQHLLHGPSRTAERRLYQARLTGEERIALGEAVMHARRCDEAEAEILRDTLIEQGLLGLIALRCGVPNTAIEQIVEQIHVQTALDQYMGALRPEAQHIIAERLNVLLTAIHDTSISLSVPRLLREYPSSPYRKKIRGRFLRRKKRLKRRDIVRHTIRQSSAQTVTVSPTSSLEEQLVTRYQQLGKFRSRGVARTRILNFVTYGPIGLLTRSEQMSAISSRIVEYLYLLKLGHLDRTVDYDAALQQANVYAATIQQPALSAQVLRAVLNGSAKPDRYNGGEGDAVAGVLQGSALYVKAPQLLKAWVVVIVPLPIPTIDSGTRQWYSQCYALLVVDYDSGLPFGCWVSNKEPRKAELGLALYDAIWHPAWTDWPVKGIPKCIQLPRTLADDAEDVRKAAAFLLTEVKLLTKKDQERLSKLRVVRETATVATSYLISQLRDDQRTCEHINTMLHRWLQEQYFPNHDSAQVPLSIRQHNTAMPAYDSPAAGWLLPTCDTVATLRNGVVLRGVQYGHDGFESAPGLTLKYRDFPYVYPHKVGGIFVECERDGEPSVEYVLQTNSRVGVSL